METICELCGAEVEDDEVHYCNECGKDGLCDDCIEFHDCEPDEIAIRRSQPGAV